MMMLDTIMKEKMVKAATPAAVQEPMEKLPTELLEMVAGGDWTVPNPYCPWCGGRLTFGREYDEETESWECWAECTGRICPYTTVWYEG